MSGNSKRPIRALGVAFCAVIVSGMALGSDPRGGSPQPPAEPKFVGSKKCETCHDAKDKGEQYSLWANGPHARAFEVLATDPAREVAAKLGIEDPQSNAHAPNESLHEGDWKHLIHSLVHLFGNLGSLPGGQVK